MYCYIIEIDDELWDIIEEGDILEVGEEGVVADRRSLTAI